MSIRKCSILLLVLGVALLVDSVNAEGGPTVGPSIIDLGVFADTCMWDSETKAYCINELGQVAGYSKYPFPYEWMPGAWDTMYVDRAFLWLPRPAYGLPAGLNNLGVLDADQNENSYSTARGMNNLGQVVGQSTMDIWPPKGFCWTPDVGMEMLMFTGNYPTMILDINNNGIAAGYGSITHVGPVNEAVSWQKIDGVWEHFRSGNLRSQYHAINDSGAMAGQKDVWIGTGYLTHAHFWWQCEAYDLGALYDWYNPSNATDINNKFQIVGYTIIGIGTPRACLWENLSGDWDDWTITDLGTLPDAQYSEAQAISDNSKIVGVSDGHAVLWEKEGGVWKITDLNDLPIPDTTWELEIAKDINKKGQIVGWGKHDGWNRSFRLTLGRWIKPKLPVGPGGPFSSDESEAGFVINVYPNPFTKNTEIAYSVQRSASSVELKICDATGRLIRQWDDKTIRQSDHVVWDGTDNFGKKVPAGIYFFSLKSDGIGSSIRKIIKLK